MTKENRLLGTAEKELSAGHSRKRRLTPDRPPRNLQSSKPKSDPFPGKVSLIRALVIAALAVTVPAVPAYAFTLQTSTETGTATETSSMEIQVLETITVARDSNIVMSLNDETNTINLYLNDQVTGTSFTAGNSVLSTSGLTITGTKEQGDTYTPQALLSSAGLSITGGTDSSSSLTPDGISTTGTVSAGDYIYVGEDESQSVLTGTALTLASGVAYTSAGATVPVIGYQNSVSGSTLSNTIVVGSTNTVGSSTASVSDLILLGSGVTTDATDAVIISPSGGTYSGLSNITVIGSGANVTYNGATAVGAEAAAGENSAALGYQATAVDNSTAVGYGSKAGLINTETNDLTLNGGSVAVGTNADATGDSATAIGYGAKATAEDTVAIGRGAIASAVGASAIGHESIATAENEVALGINSVASTASGVTGWNPTGEDVSGAAWISTDGAVSVGAKANENAYHTAAITRQITNVAAGTADTDAVNVAQLKNSNIVVQGDTGDDSVIKNGETLILEGGASTTDAVTDDNILVRSDGGTFSFSLVEDVDLGSTGSLTVGATVLDNSGVTTSGGTFTANAVQAEGQTAAATASLTSSGLTVTSPTTAESPTAVTTTVTSNGIQVGSADNQLTTSGLTASAATIAGALSAGSVTSETFDTGTVTLTVTGLTYDNGMVYTSAGQSVPVIGYNNSVVGNATNSIVMGNGNTAGDADTPATGLIMLGNGISSDSSNSVIINPTGGTYNGIIGLVAMGTTRR
jgi:predicted regulator of Ras-like GTPase activity (Roadblock/LC7/MglB family)